MERRSSGVLILIAGGLSCGGKGLGDSWVLGGGGGWGWMGFDGDFCGRRLFLGRGDKRGIENFLEV